MKNKITPKSLIIICISLIISCEKSGVTEESYPISDVSFNYLQASNKFFIWHQKNLLFGIKKKLSGPEVSKIICFCIFRVFMDGWFGISLAGALGSLEPFKPYGSYDLATRRRLNLTPTMIWRPTSTETLRNL